MRMQLLMRWDSLLMRRDSLLMRRDSLLMRTDSLLMRTDSLLMRRDALLMSMKTCSHEKWSSHEKPPLLMRIGFSLDGAFS
jgi:hypothetical protein